jgi:hypothetical protein
VRFWIFFLSALSVMAAPWPDHLFVRDESLIDTFRKAASFFDGWLE